MAPELVRGRKYIYLPKQHCICHIVLKLNSVGLSVLLSVSCPWLPPNCIWISPPKGRCTRGSSHLQILRAFLRGTGGIPQGQNGSFWISFPCSQGGWFMRDSRGCPVSSSHKSVCSYRPCCKGAGTVNPQESQVQQKTMNSGSLFSLSRTDVHQISSGFNSQSLLFHQNSQRQHSFVIISGITLKAELSRAAVYLQACFHPFPKKKILSVPLPQAEPLL